MAACLCLNVCEGSSNQLSDLIRSCFPCPLLLFLSKVLSWDDSRKTDGFYDLSIQFQLSLLDHGYEVFHQACFLLDGVSHGAICDAVYVGDV